MAFEKLSIFLCLLKLHLLIGFVGSNHLSLNSNCVIGGVTTPGWTAPNGDIVLEIGTPLEIYCSLNSDDVTIKGFSAENIVFKKNGEKIDQKCVTVINETTARLYMDHLPISSKEERFDCILELNEGNDSQPYKNSLLNKSEDLICSNNVLIGSKPQEVINFTCINYNWEILNCTWDEPNNGIETNYSISYWLPRKSRKNHLLHQCPVPEKKRCTWTTTSAPTYRRFFKYLYFQMDGLNKFGNISRTFTFNNYEHVIPSPPKDITSSSTTPHSIFLQWNFGMWVIFDMELDFKVEYARNSTQDWKTIRYGGKEVKKHKDIVRVNVTDFQYPNMPYDFKIYMKSPLAGEDYWSQPGSGVIKTSPCAPYVSPETDTGNFEVYNEYLHYRDVLVYWKQIPELEHNGDDLHYKIVVWENNSRVNVRPVFIGSSYANFTNLSFDSYKFEIKSINAIGSAPYSSVVHLPKKQDILPKPISFTKADTPHGAYHLSWQMPKYDDSKITNYTIFWCESNREYSHTVPCKGPLNWTHLTPGTFKHKFSSDPSIRYEFAISVNSLKSSSGMMWATCGALQKEKINKIKYIWPVEIGSSYINLRWKLDCAGQVDSIRGFNLTYCMVSATNHEFCTEPENTAVVYGNATVNLATLIDLQPSSYYKIYIFAFTDYAFGLPSADIWIHTRSNASQDPQNGDVSFTNLTELAVNINSGISKDDCVKNLIT